MSVEGRYVVLKGDSEMTTDDAKPEGRQGFARIGATAGPPPPQLRFDELKRFDEGRLWERLNKIYAVAEILPEELPPPTLYHYTDIRGLHGILDSNCLRASAAYYLNDSSEVEYGRRLFLEELQNWLDANKEGKGISHAVLLAIHAVFASDESKISRQLNIYVSCFCQEDDVLSQWRAYGQKGGYSLGFDTRRLSSDLTAPVYYNRVRLAKVEYREGMQLQRIQSVLRQFFTAIAKADQVPLPVGVNVKDLVHDLIFLLLELLLDEIVTFKHPAFEDEREWRLIARFDFRAEIKSTPPGEKTEPLFQLRESGGYLLPYVDLKPTGAKIPLTSINFGPSLDFERYQTPIVQLLAQREFPDVKVKGSRLPVIL